jgi:hypothetical protein
MQSLRILTSAILLLSFCTIFPKNAIAQVTHFEVHVAYQAVWILNQNNYGMSELDYESRIGASWGAALGIDYGKSLGLQLEVNWTKLGQDYLDNTGLPLILGINDVFLIKKEVDLNYIQVPILLRFRPKGQKSRFLALLGPQIGFLGKSDIRYWVEDEAYDFSEIPGQLFAELTAPKDFFNTIDFGIAAGIAMEIPIGNVAFFRPALRFYYGLTDINDQVTAIGSNYSGSKNAFIGLNLGFGLSTGNEFKSIRRTPGR